MFVSTQAALTNCGWENHFLETTQGISRHPKHPQKHELKDSHWYQGTHLDIDRNMFSSVKAPLDLNRIGLDLKTPLKWLYG